MHMLEVMLDDIAIMPRRAHDYDAGLDLFTPVDFVVPAHSYAFVDTGVHMQVPAGMRGHVCSRSGLNRDHGITADGTIDTGYTGSVGVVLHNDGDEDVRFVRGAKVAQVVFELIWLPEPTLVDHIYGIGTRGDDGFGSTGR